MLNKQSLSENQLQSIAKDAQRLSDGTKLKIDFLYEVLLKCATPLSDGRYYFSPDPGKMLQHIDAKELPNVFQLGPDLLRSMEALAFVPRMDFFYTYDESRAFVAKFIKYLTDNKASLISTGLPTYRFSGPDYFDYYLGFNLVTRVPQRIEYSMGTSGAMHCRYFWQDTNGGETFKYEDASSIHGCTPQLERSIETARESLFEFKLAVISEIDDALCYLEPTTLLDRFIVLKNRHISKDSAASMKELAALHSDNFDEYCTTLNEETEAMHIVSGAISEIELFVSNVASSLETGFHQKIRIAFGDLMSVDADSQLKFSLGSVYQAYNTPNWDRLINLARLNSKLAPLWGDLKWTYDSKVRGAESDLTKTLAIKAVDAEIIRQHPPTEPPSAYSISRSSEVWTITFNENSIQFVDSKGLQYLAFLLKNPHKKFEVIDLVQHVELGLTSDQIQMAKSHLGETMATEMTYEPVLDKRGRQTVEAEIARLQMQQQTHPNESTQSELERLIQIYKRDQALAGKVRAVTDDREKARKSVTNNITRARDKIRSENEDLWRHLQNAVHTGAEMYYSPDQPINWTIVI